MSNDFIATSSVTIHASVAEVWDALINPDKVKQYLFGTQVISDWKAGSSITYKGEWEGKTYEDKGQVLNVVPEKILETTYWSSMSGIPDLPENYNKVTYALSPLPDGTELTVTQDNIETEESREHSEKNWAMVLNGLKELLEK